jgi:hypothetical protein
MKEVFIAYRNPCEGCMYLWKDILNQTTESEFQLEPDMLHTDLEDPMASEIHSIDHLYSQHQGQSYLLLGMRHGYMISCKLRRRSENNDNVPLLEVEARANKFGQSQVEFISATHDDFEESRGRYERCSVFVRCEYLWQITLQDGELRIDEVLFDDIRTVPCQSYAS